MKATYLKVNAVKDLVHSRGKIANKSFIHALDTHIHEMIEKACNQFNGGRKTIDSSVAAFVGIGGVK